LKKKKKKDRQKIKEEGAKKKFHLGKVVATPVAANAKSKKDPGKEKASCHTMSSDDDESRK